jgi:hypothetical protein
MRVWRLRKRITIDVSGNDRDTLTAIVTDRNSPQKHVWRAQIVLLTADGCGTMELTRRTGTSKTSVRRWQAANQLRVPSPGFEPMFPSRSCQIGNDILIFPYWYRLIYCRHGD